MTPDNKDILTKLVVETEIPERFIPASGETIDHYRVEKILGEGTFGLVCKVVDLNTHQVRAMKLLKLWEVIGDERIAIIRRFQGEFRCGLIEDKHLVRSYDFGKTHGNPYIIMQYCPNGDLRSRIKQRMPLQQVNQVAKEILLGLKALHTDGIIHRDLKPENVIFDENNTPHLTDFGIAGFTNARMTKKNIFGHAMGLFGTYAYMPPEQLNTRISFKTMSPATDIYSFGAMMFEVLTTKLPFGKLESESDLGLYVMRAHKGEKEQIRQLRPDVPDYWVKIIDGCLQPDYNLRFHSAGDVLALFGPEYASSQQTIIYDFRKDCIGLKVMKGEDHDRVYNLSSIVEAPNGIVTIGWADPGKPGKNDIEITENQTNYISGYHATLEKISQHNCWFIRDGQWRQKDGSNGWYLSTNGVYVNSRQAGMDGCPIYPGDIITLGDTTLKVIIVPTKTGSSVPIGPYYPTNP